MKPNTPSLDDTQFDVREISPRVKHAQIFQRWYDLPVGNHFVLINDHDPVPLWYQFSGQFAGCFNWEYLERGPELFRVKITKVAPVDPSLANAGGPAAGANRSKTAADGAPAAQSSATKAAAPTAPTSGAASADIQEIDARGLEPPEPLVRILDALERLPAGKRLRAITDRQPCHLFGEAEHRGFRHDCTAQPDGSWITLLERA